MASFALFNFEFEPIQNKLRQAELNWMFRMSIRIRTTLSASAQST